ncbi:MAG: hypothetical protein LAP87_30940 [Acidobacteriia bacterium]|nr:hypothetical protein [Terriglobia bacterium]
MFHSVWFGYSNDTLGSSWTTVQAPAIPASACGPNCGWDYPSVAVDGLGQIMIGAVAEGSSTTGYYVTMVDQYGAAIPGLTLTQVG